jgi:hypothetical protein
MTISISDTRSAFAATAQSTFEMTAFAQFEPNYTVECREVRSSLMETYEVIAGNLLKNHGIHTTAEQLKNLNPTISEIEACTPIRVPVTSFAPEANDVPTKPAEPTIQSAPQDTAHPATRPLFPYEEQLLKESLKETLRILKEKARDPDWPQDMDPKPTAPARDLGHPGTCGCSS